MTACGEEHTERITRRDMSRAVSVGAATVVAPSFAEVVRGETDSGHVEIETTATIPTDTNINIRVFEDADGDGTADLEQAEDIPNGSDTTAYDALEGTTGQGYRYWMEITLSQSTGGSSTPELDTMTITLPDEQSDPDEEAAEEPQGIFELWDNFLAFVAVLTLGIGGLALTSKSMALASFSAYLVFAYVALETGHSLLMNILYVTAVLIFVGMAFKLWRLEGGGE